MGNVNATHPRQDNERRRQIRFAQLEAMDPSDYLMAKLS